jgi:uncharacterized protein (DUF1697 family)
MSQISRYVCLLRGINVGGNNIIKMVDLKNCFEKNGYVDVRTYIQSGNVIFSASVKEDILISKIEELLFQTFNLKIVVVVISVIHLQSIVKNAPYGFGEYPNNYRYDVIFLKKPLTSNHALQSISIKEGVDDVHAGQQVLYFSRKLKDITKSKLSQIITLPIYKNMTIRNWNTTTKLLSLI